MNTKQLERGTAGRASIAPTEVHILEQSNKRKDKKKNSKMHDDNGNKETK